MLEGNERWYIKRGLRESNIVEADLCALGLSHTFCYLCVNHGFRCFRATQSGTREMGNTIGTDFLGGEWQRICVLRTEDKNQIEQHVENTTKCVRIETDKKKSHHSSHHETIVVHLYWAHPNAVPVDIQ